MKGKVLGAAACAVAAALWLQAETVGLASAATLSETPVAPIGETGTLSGCENPRIGRNGDRGSGKSAVFVDVQNMRPGHDPVYSSNSVFWTSRENRPGQNVLMSGAFAHGRKTVRIAPLSRGTTDWRSAVQQSNITAPAIPLSSTGLIFQIPPELHYAPYAWRIEDHDPAVPPIEGIVNRPEPQWILGTPATDAPLEAPAHRLVNCGAEAGGKLRLFGKNINGTREVYLQSADNRQVQLPVEQTDDTALTASVPADLPPGPYHLWIGSPDKDATASLPVPVRIVPAPPAPRVVTCGGLNGDGTTDNSGPLQACLDNNRSNDGPVVVQLPAGQYAISRPLSLRRYQHLVGESEAATVLTGTASSAGATPKAWVVGDSHFGVASLTIRAPHRDAVIRAASLGSDPDRHGHVLINRVTIEVSADYTGGGQHTRLIKLSGPDLRILNSTLNAPKTLLIDYGDGVLLSGLRSNRGDYAIANSQNVVITRNLLGSPTEINEGVVIGAARPMVNGTTANAARNLYVGYNLFRNMTYTPTNQFFTTDGGGGAYLGRIASATANQVILAADPNWDLVGTSNPENVLISIVAGHGVGQYRPLRSIRGRIMELERPWDVVPDSSSVIDITTGYLRITVSHNEFHNMHGHALNSVLFFGGVFDSVIDHNYNENAGDGIAVAAYGPYGINSYLPTFNVDCIDNTVVEDGDGTFLMRTAKQDVSRGIAVMGMPGAALSGILVRGNRVTTPGRIFFPNSFKDNYSVLVEHNQAAVEPWFGGSSGPSGALIRPNGR
ncbi:glycoside hydrolase family 55 protein [Cupriavidus sp. AU9028]|uniref:glycoside hydrolase family 55 protein n=1 Tax=Cupriavidus sp. AU9028 TaxID=2871157 RepID=UPI001C98E17C|nr:glycoside hydrolase family 55 protein [Cupriavidus sp. AU9028]MBY4899201.1 glycoside hydrolase family 55 protein [Cupriavidus sp. AU9028]